MFFADVATAVQDARLCEALLADDLNAYSCFPITPSTEYILAIFGKAKMLCMTGVSETE